MGNLSLWILNFFYTIKKLFHFPTLTSEIMIGKMQVYVAFIAIIMLFLGGALACYGK